MLHFDGGKAEIGMQLMSCMCPELGKYAVAVLMIQNIDQVVYEINYVH